MAYDIDVLKTLLGNSNLKRIKNKKFMSVFDFFLLMPKKYVYIRDFQTIAHLQENLYTHLTGRITACFRKRQFLTCDLRDSTGVLRVVFYHATRPIVQQIYQGQYRDIHLVGLITKDERGRLQLVQPICLQEKRALNFLPLYPMKHGIPSERYYQVFHHLSLIHDPQQRDYLSPAIRAKYALIHINEALRELHWPTATNVTTFKYNLERSLERLELEEVLAHFAYEQQERTTIKDKPAFFLVKIDYVAHQKFLAALPFQLTQDQSSAIADIFHDFERKQAPMFRLLQGDVGCGKTVVVAAALLQVHLNHYQTLMLVPTIILAEQHKKTLEKLLAPFNVPVTVLAGKLSSSVTQQRFHAISSQANGVIIGTQMLMTAMPTYTQAALVLIDEQHRFGVSTRGELLHKIEQATQLRPHSISLTATPIPRTLLMARCHYMDSSIIHELPPQRKKVQTLVMTMAKRLDLIEALRDAVQAGNQVYWVCRSIDKLQQEQRGVHAAYELISSMLGTSVSIGIVHGQLKAAVIEETLQQFSCGALAILVATTIVEVGLDIPQATIMVIEDADHFGLAQLHQLRGRVGRGAAQSYCILLYSTKCTPAAARRLQVIRHEHAGDKLAALDLATRGAGNFLGTEQSGLRKWKIVRWLKIPQYLPLVKKIAAELDPETMQQLFQRWLPLA